MKKRLGVLFLFASTLAACESDSSPPKVATPDPDAAVAATPSPYADVPLSETLEFEGLSGPVEIVRDDFGIPHVYGETDADVAFAQGYMMASDRWIQMDLGRRQGSGRLAELFGTVAPEVVDADITYRTHHLRQNAEAIWNGMTTSSDPTDQKGVAVLESFTKGVNAWQTELKAGKRHLPPQVEALYSVNVVEPWSPVDSLTLGELQAFSLSFDAASEIERSRLDASELQNFTSSSPPANAARVGFIADLYRFAPFDPTYTVDGWANAKLASAKKRKPKALSASALALYRRTALSQRSIGLDPERDPSRGSNNWVVSGKLTASGRPMVANDTHLSLAQPAIFYLVHLESKQGLNVMGVQFVGVPLVILGMNRHIAWGSTVSYVDVTDVYRETIKPCGPDKCVSFKGAEVKLTTRLEKIGVGLNGSVNVTKDVTVYEVPHHGPIALRSKSGEVEPLGTEEFSVRFTGHQPAQNFRAISGLVLAKNADEARAAVERDFKVGGQNWVIADDAGNIVWTQAIRAPRRPKGTEPWKVLPSDGSAEWNGDHDVKSLPAGKNPERGFFATANADPLGVTADNDPMNEPEVDGFPLYLGWSYDPGTRVGRITRRIQDATKDGKKLTREDMASIQADAVSELGRAIAPAFVEGATALSEELATPGAHPEIASTAAALSDNAKAVLAPALDAVKAWSFDTPAGADGDTAETLRDSRATVAMAVFTNQLARNVVSDEFATLGIKLEGWRTIRLLATLIRSPDVLKTKAVIWDDLGTTGQTETRLQMTARSVAAALDVMVKSPSLGADANAWRWGNVHRLASTFPLPVGLDAPLIPRHGGIGTVDVAHHPISTDSFNYGSGAAIRFVAELDPEKGPAARNVLPGGQIFYKESPHFADMLALWAKNEALDLAFAHADIVPRAQKEQATNGLGRIVLKPR